jgi:chromosome segregation ATPase
MAYFISRSRRRTAHGGNTAHGDNRHVTDLTTVRSEVENLRDRSKILEERFDRYDHTTAELRDGTAQLRESVEGRLTRLGSHDDVHKSLQEQIFEIRKEHQILMERDERHERRLSELLDQLGSLRTEMSMSQGDGHKVRR